MQSQTLVSLSTMIFLIPTLASYPSSPTPSSTPCPRAPFVVHEYHHLEKELYPLYISTFIPVNTVLAVPGIEPLAVTNAPTPLELYTMATRTVTVTETETVWASETSAAKDDLLENVDHYLVVGTTVSGKGDGTPTVQEDSQHVLGIAEEL